jgi:hypothetical protein
MNCWPEFVGTLGDREHSSTVNDLFSSLGEAPVISESPDIFDDSQGRTLAYKFIASGLEFGFRAQRLNHIHVFVTSHEGYSAYEADMLGQPAQVWNRDQIIRHLGPAQDEAPSRSDALIGHTKAWVIYEFDTFDLRIEFSDDGHLWKATLMDK